MFGCQRRLLEVETFFFLDAHGREHLPLREELEIILTHWREAIVMIDDFEVPGTDYGYDDYGPGKVHEYELFGAHSTFAVTRLFSCRRSEGRNRFEAWMRWSFVEMKH